MVVLFPTVSTDASLCSTTFKSDSFVLGRFSRHNFFMCRLCLTSQGAWFDSGVEDPCGIVSVWGSSLDLSLLYAMNCISTSKHLSSSRLLTSLVFCQRNLVWTSWKHSARHTKACWVAGTRSFCFRSAFLSQTKKVVWMQQWILCICGGVCALKLFFVLLH